MEGVIPDDVVEYRHDTGGPAETEDRDDDFYQDWDDAEAWLIKLEEEENMLREKEEVLEAVRSIYILSM